MTEPIPLIYLDQNVLSEISKGKFRGLLELITSGKLQLIYSPIHISETARCGEQGFRESIVQTISTMNGGYIYEGKIHFDKSAKVRLEDSLNDPIAYEQLSNGLEQLLHKFFGGQQGRSFSSLIETQQDAFENLMGEMKRNILILGESEDAEILGLLPMMEMLPNLYQQQFKEESEKLSAKLKDIPAPETFNGAKSFREAVGISPLSLNNIRPPNVMKSIWEQVCASGIIPSQISSASEFLNQAVWRHTNDAEPKLEEQIGSYYSLLNMLGYFSDTKLHKEHRFRSAMGDQTHASYAAFAQVFITGDERMAKKTYAIYELLDIGTAVCWCKPEKTGGCVLLCNEQMFQAV